LIRQANKARKSMKVTSTSLALCRCLVILATLLFGQRVSAVEPALNILVASQVPPKMFVTDDGKPSGYFTDLAVAIFLRAGYPPNVVAVPWARAMFLAQSGDGVIVSLSMTPERAEIYAYSDVVLEDRVLIVTMKKSHITAASLADLKGKRVGYNRGSSYGVKFDAELPLVDGQPDASSKLRLQKLAADHIDAAIIPGGMASVRYNAKLAGIAMADLTVQTTPLALDKNYLGIAKSRADASQVLKRLNTAIASMKADGSIAKIVATWE